MHTLTYMTRNARLLQAQLCKSYQMKPAAIFEIEDRMDVLPNWCSPHMTIINMMSGLNNKIWAQDGFGTQSFHDKWDEVAMIAAEALRKTNENS